MYIINPESNQIVCDTAEEAAEYTGMDIDLIAAMKPGEMITDGTESGSQPANFAIIYEE